MTVERFTSRGRSTERRREAVREIREELERIRRSEARIAEALGSARAARQRVEELVRVFALEDEGIREIVREELRAAGSGPVPVGDSADRAVVSSLFTPDANANGEEDPETDARRDDDGFRRPLEDEEEPAATAPRRPFWLIGVAALSLFVVTAVGWLAYRTFDGRSDAPTLTVGGDSAPPLEGPREDAAGAAAAASEPSDGPSAAEAVDDAERFFTLLPESAPARAQVYDSLWQARSEVFSPLLERVAGATEEGSVRRALEAWGSGTMTPLQRDLLHSAFVQYALREQAGAELALDGQLLRNPCRGASCSALLNFWETRGAALGLPPVPEDAPRNTQALRVAESVLVLRALEDVHRARANHGE